MKTIVQRVKSASVTVDGQLISAISKGLLVFAAVDKNDTRKDVESMASKVLKVKLWSDSEGKKWARNVQEIDGEILCVSQFTLLASTKKGNKPSFHQSALPAKARELYDSFVGEARKLYDQDKVKDGVFGAMMDVGILNDGPVGLDYRCDDEAVTIEIETNPPEMTNPTSMEPFEQELGQVPTVKTHIHQTFEYPASLLE